MFTTRNRLKEDGEKADEILEGLKKVDESVKPNEPDVPAVPAVPVVEEPIVKIDEPTNDVPPEVDTLKTENEELKKQLDKDKQRYLSLQGMFNKMNKELEAIKNKLPEKPAEPIEAKPVEPVFKSDVLEKLKKDYGDEVVDVITHYAKIVADKIVVGKLKEHGDRVTKVEETAGKSVQEIFFSNLLTSVPDWKTINGWKPENIPQDPKWTEFLHQEIPGTMKTYSQVLIEGYQNLNAQAVAKVFNLYKSSIKSKEEDNPSPKVPEPSKSVMPNINAHIDPGSGGGGGGGAPPTDNKKKIYSQKEVDGFYNSISKKTFVGTAEDRARLEDTYSTAIVEGRVR